MKKIVSIVAVAAVLCCEIQNVFANEQSGTKTFTAEVRETAVSSSIYLSRASNKFMKRDVSGAIGDINLAIKVDPQNPSLYLNRGYLKQVLNNYDGALEDYNQALKLNPNYAEAYNNRGVLYAAMKNTKGAMEDYAAALQLNPKYSDVYYNRGNLKYMLSDNKGALADFDKAIEYNPKDAEAYNNRGVVKRRMNLNVGALSDYSQAIALNPNDSIAYANRGKLKKQYFDNEGAAIDLDKAVELAENQTFIKNVKPLLSNDRYIAAIPVVNGITSDNPQMAKIEPLDKERLAAVKEPKIEIKTSNKSSEITQNQNIKPVTATKKDESNEVKPAVVNQEKKSDASIETKTEKKQIAISPDIRTNSVKSAPTTNEKLAESYYIRGLQKCVLRDLKGAISDLDRAIQNNNKYADAYFYRAAIKKELGDIAGFKQDYKTAITINPALQTFNDANAISVISG